MGRVFLLAKVSRNWAHRWWKEGERQGEEGKGEEVEEKDFFVGEFLEIKKFDLQPIAFLWEKEE